MGKLKAEIDDVAAQADQAHILNSQMEKKAKQFDRIVGEWKQKADGLSMDLDRSQAESRNASAELFRVKSAYEEGVLQLDEVRKENKNLRAQLELTQLRQEIERRIAEKEEEFESTRKNFQKAIETCLVRLNRRPKEKL